MVELNPAAWLWCGLRNRRIRALLGSVEQLKDSLGRSNARLQHVGHRGELGERLRELTRVLNERLHIAKAHRPRRNSQPANDGDGHEIEVAEEHHRGLDQTSDELRAETCFV